MRRGQFLSLGSHLPFTALEFRVLRRERNRITALRIMPLARKPVAKLA